MQNTIQKSSPAALPKIPGFIVASPSDNGNDNGSASEWAWIIQHEIDLFEEGEESDIRTRAQLATAKRCLEKLRALAPAFCLGC